MSDTERLIVWMKAEGALTALLRVSMALASAGCPEAYRAVVEVDLEEARKSSRAAYDAWRAGGR